MIVIPDRLSVSVITHSLPLTTMSKLSQANRQRRNKIYDDFSRNEYHELCDYYEVIEFPNKFYKIITKQGAIDFYPMSDKICM